MTGMVERVARELHRNDGFEALVEWNDLDEDSRQMYVFFAKVAIEAMKEPTTEMEIAGTEQWLCEAAMEDRAGVNYRAMITAALEGE
ncbi:hypothetical protein [Thalassospira marina]|uniref:Uncharacterized protein n=1 Tax=Thalassospira marina TaxID=2048283 RepID=A0A2N3KY55_9PROT|nr:hypothetical protein [Thalassospira marina]PKR55420.1 hypothetical protein COO20_04415 [Thalassospira marina]